MLFFKKKNKINKPCGVFGFAELKKLIKRDKQSVFIPLESGKHALQFCKVNNVAYAPIPTQTEKMPIYYKIVNITFVTQFDDNGKKQNTYNIAITYDKNGHNHFYSYDDCDCAIKDNICQQLGGIVNIQIRNKEELHQKQPKYAEKTGAMGLESLKTHVEHINTTRREFLTRSIKHITPNQHFSDEERLKILQEAVEKVKQIKIEKEKKDNQRKLDSVKNDEQTKRYFQKIKFNDKKTKDNKNLQSLPQEELDDMLFFE